MKTNTFFRAAAATALALAGCLQASPSLAYDAAYFGYLADSNMHNLMLNQISRNAELTRQLSSPGTGRAPAESKARRSSATQVPLRAQPMVPARLAAQYPQPSRPGAERALRQMLAAYMEVERRFGIPRGDLAGAIAAYIAGSYMAYNGVHFPTDNFRPLVTQVRNIISASPVLRQASAADKQDLYEQLAIAGIWLVHSEQTLRQHPDQAQSARLRQSGKDGLEKFLNIDADRLHIGAQGMRLR